MKPKSTFFITQITEAFLFKKNVISVFINVLFLSVFLSSYGQLSTNSNTLDLFYETFEGETDSDITGIDAHGNSWQLDTTNNMNAQEFFVHGRGDEFHAMDNAGVGIWYTSAINISNYSNLKFSILINRTYNLLSADYIKFQYSIDDSDSKITIDQIYNDMPSNSELSYDLSGIEGNTIKIFIEIYHSDPNSIEATHEFDNIRLTGNELLSNNQVNINNIGIKSIINTKQLLITGNIVENSALNIYDMSGKIVMQTTLASYSGNRRIDLSSFNSGVYLINVKNTSESFSKQFLVK